MLLRMFHGLRTVANAEDGHMISSRLHKSDVCSTLSAYTPHKHEIKSESDKAVSLTDKEKFEELTMTKMRNRSFTHGIREPSECRALDCRNRRDGDDLAGPQIIIIDTFHALQRANMGVRLLKFSSRPPSARVSLV